MLVVEHITQPGVVWATHSDWQLVEISEAYPASEFSIHSGDEFVACPGHDVPIPAGYEAVRAAVPSEPEPEPETAQ